MSKSIIGFFESHGDAQNVVQDLLNQNIARDRISIIAGHPEGAGQQDAAAGMGATTGAFAGMGILGLTTFLLPGIGMIVAGGPLAAAAAASGGDQEDDTPVDNRLYAVLRGTGLMEEQLRSYTESLAQGRSLVAVDADEDQTESIADVFHRHGAVNLTFRRTDTA